MKAPTTAPSGSTSSPADPDPTRPPVKPLSSGAAVGGRGGPDDELLIDGQEEVFSRTEVEMGRMEHGAAAGGGGGGDTPVSDPQPTGNAPAPTRRGRRF